jgi:hypothetical protein
VEIRSKDRIWRDSQLGPVEETYRKIDVPQTRDLVGEPLVDADEQLAHVLFAHDILAWSAGLPHYYLALHLAAATYLVPHDGLEAAAADHAGEAEVERKVKGALRGREYGIKGALDDGG